METPLNVQLISPCCHFLIQLWPEAELNPRGTVAGREVESWLTGCDARPVLFKRLINLLDYLTLLPQPPAMVSVDVKPSVSFHRRLPSLVTLHQVWPKTSYMAQ